MWTRPRKTYALQSSEEMELEQSGHKSNVTANLLGEIKQYALQCQTYDWLFFPKSEDGVIKLCNFYE